MYEERYNVFGSTLFLIAAAFAGIAILGLLTFGGRGGPRRFGRLPGDIRHEGRGVKVYAPLTSMLLLSLALSALLTILFWLFG
jgi:hypothetical protein